jgi:hypothetical protein
MSAKTYHYLYSPIDIDGSAPDTEVISIDKNAGASAIFSAIGKLVKKDTMNFFTSAGFNNLETVESEIGSKLGDLLIPKIPDVLSDRFQNAVLTEKDASISIDQLKDNILNFYSTELNLVEDSSELKSFKDNLDKIKNKSLPIYKELNYYFGRIVENLAIDRAKKEFKDFFKDSELKAFDVVPTGKEPGTTQRQVKGDYFIEFKIAGNDATFRLGVSVKGSRSDPGSKNPFANLWSIGSQSFSEIATTFLNLESPLELNDFLFGGEKLIIGQQKKYFKAKKIEVDGEVQLKEFYNVYNKNPDIWNSNRNLFTALVFDVVAFGYRTNRPLLKENWQSDNEGNPSVKIEFLYQIFEKLAANPGSMRVSGDANGMSFKVAISK